LRRVTGRAIHSSSPFQADLSLRRKGDPEKVQMASELRAQSTMTLKWIAQRLKMGAWTHVSNCLVQKRKNGKKCQ
jgi:hypothetical protein